MRITYDADVDALVVELAPDVRSANLVKLGPGIIADLDKDGRLIAIERCSTPAPGTTRRACAGLARPGDGYILDDSFPPPGFYDSRTWRVRRRGRWWTIQTASGYVLSRHLSRGTAAAKLRTAKRRRHSNIESDG